MVAKVAGTFRTTHKVNEIDGVRVQFPHGWGLLRASNTQPALVMRFEATSDEELKKYQEEMEAALAKAKAS